uniref:Putative ovule protein n=1 Tax=Solanum chacoense TaxID=4108 RepID=A0A0V0HJ22_SOLCH
MSEMVFCGEQAETVRHLFLHCKITCQLWRLFINLKGFSWTMPGKVTEALQSWEEVGVLARSRCRWRIIPANIWWTIWKERNSRCFENIENSIEQIKLNCILILCFWCNQIRSNDLYLLLMC